ncbi:hypothetical protein DINM_007154 [Dirofilaria immitis]|nr:hypothetical protein [Dirofilaria immitis]
MSLQLTEKIESLMAYIAFEWFFDCVCSMMSFQTAATPGNLKIHHRIHTGEKPFKCGACALKFNQFSNLKRHQRQMHTTKPFKCNICRKEFSNPGNLKKHHRTHIDEKAFNCKLYGKEFSRNHDLRRPEKNINIELKDCIA